MAFYIPIRLVEESADCAVYEYSQAVLEPDPERRGRFKTVRTNVGLVTVSKVSDSIEQVSGDEWDSDRRYFVRVAAKLRECQEAGVVAAGLSLSAWKGGAGPLPAMCSPHRESPPDA